MTTYQGARARPIGLAPRRRISSPARARRRRHPAAVLLAAVLMTLMLGLVYLAQAIHLAATNYEIELLLRERDDLARQVKTMETTMLRWASEPLVLERGQQAGLDPLGPRLRVPAH